MEKLSFVIPCYGSELTIKGVLDEIHVVMAERPEYDYEIICVNDCSPDNVLGVLREYVVMDSRLIIADLTKNMGKACAVMAGCSLASGDYIINLDDDGQCPMDKLWLLFEPILGGYDVVYAGYPIKKQSSFKNFGSKVNAVMSQRIIGKPKALKASNFSILRRFIMEEMIKYTNPFPYTLGLILKITDNICNVSMEQRERSAGHGNFTFKKSLALWLNGFTAFSVVPLRVSSLLGFITAIAGLAYGIFIIIQRLFINPNMMMGFPSIMAAMLFIGGMIMLMLGMLGEYVGRIYINQNNLPQYVIKNVYVKSSCAQDEN